MLAGHLLAFEIRAGTRGCFGETDKIRAGARLRRHPPTRVLFHNVAVFGELQPALLACIHGTSLPL
jgi:hypothetical protein